VELPVNAGLDYKTSSRIIRNMICSAAVSKSGEAERIHLPGPVFVILRDRTIPL